MPYDRGVAEDRSDEPEVTLREAIQAGDVYVAMQPIIDLRAGTIFGLETLLRSLTDTFRTPGDMLKVALEGGWIGELGREVRKMATAAAPDARLFVNVHPDEFSDGWLVRPDDPIYFHDQQVFLEITESVPISHHAQCHSILREVRDRGVLLVVDDLGAGYSNLKYIVDLSPEIVKVDRDLVANLDRDKRLRTLLRSMVRMCEDLGAKVVAEGIETEAELRVAVESGVHYGQGFYIARPAHPVAKIDWEALRRAGVPASQRESAPARLPMSTTPRPIPKGAAGPGHKRR
jgi:EAL domain-containing protein (putative c-di-GMP-specific phosphodiesterase class I)